MSVNVARTLEEVEALRPVWERIDWPNPEADIDYFTGVLTTSPEILRPHVIHVDRPGRPPLMAIGRVEQHALETKIGYRVLLRPRMRILTVVYAGISGADSDADHALILGELRGALARGEADVLCLTKLQLGTPLRELAAAAAPRACRDHLPAVFPRSDVEVPDDFAAFLKARSRNTRDNVKRYGKRLEQAHGDQLRIDRYRDERDIDALFARFEPVAATTYQRALGVGFRDEPRQRELTAIAMRNGWFRGWSLSIGDKPVAFWYGMAYAGTFFIGTPGYDPDYGDLRVGQYLQMRMMEDLCAEEGVTRLDYGFGDAQYKRSFGDRSWEESDVMIFAGAPRAIAVNASRTAVAGGTRLARRALGPERVAELKRRARRSRASASAAG
jgi:CelD/BcsL family acetyltransferase involved in cellulose biosynthesis